MSPSGCSKSKRGPRLRFYINSQSLDVYDYDCRKANADIISNAGLDGLREGRSVTLYHGTTRLFRRFTLEAMSDEQTDSKFQRGAGIFFAVSQRVAQGYATGNRNWGLSSTVVDDLKRKNRAAGALLEELVKKGSKGWAAYLEATGLEFDALSEALHIDDLNDLNDIASYVEGSAFGASDSSTLSEMFGMGGVGMPDDTYDALDRVGLNSRTYRPKVYTVAVTCHNAGLIVNPSQAKRARQQGHDCVVYDGEAGIEVIVFDPKRIRIQKVDVVE